MHILLYLLPYKPCITYMGNNLASWQRLTWHVTCWWWKTHETKTWPNWVVHTKYWHEVKRRHLIKTTLTEDASKREPKRGWMKMLWLPKYTMGSLTRCQEKRTTRCQPTGYRWWAIRAIIHKTKWAPPSGHPTYFHSFQISLCRASVRMSLLMINWREELSLFRLWGKQYHNLQ